MRAKHEEKHHGGSQDCSKMFRDSFKYYKSRNPAPDLGEVIDLESPDRVRVRINNRYNYIIMFFQKLIANVISGQEDPGQRK